MCLTSAIVLIQMSVDANASGVAIRPARAAADLHDLEQVIACL